MLDTFEPREVWADFGDDFQRGARIDAVDAR